MQHRKISYITLLCKVLCGNTLIQQTAKLGKILEIPAAVEDYPVVHIGSLGENDSVEEVIFDRDKITFSDDAFIDCDKLGTYNV